MAWLMSSVEQVDPVEAGILGELVDLVAQLVGHSTGKNGRNEPPTIERRGRANLVNPI
jgi:hypothetical protein